MSSFINTTYIPTGVLVTDITMDQLENLYNLANKQEPSNSRVTKNQLFFSIILTIFGVFLGLLILEANNKCYWIGLLMSFLSLSYVGYDCYADAKEKNDKNSAIAIKIKELMDKVNNKNITTV